MNMPVNQTALSDAPAANVQRADRMDGRAAAANSVLFVDDDPNILGGLRRMLRPMRGSWDLEFVASARAALTRMAEKTFEIVVSDMRMPEMDGAALFREVMLRHPETVRIILSGQSDQQGVLNAVGCTHQFLSKPCDPRTLTATISQALALRDRLATPAVKRLTAHVQSLPSSPAVFRALLAEVQSSTGSIDRVGEIISQDMAMSAKLLHLANSSFFGMSRAVASPAQAATILGFDIVKSMVLFADVVSQSTVSGDAGPLLNPLTRHSLEVAAKAKAIAAAEKCDKQQINEAFMAGLLHDVGTVLLIANQPERYLQVLEAAGDRGISRLAAETELLGATHAEIGAYLMGLWGLPPSIVDAIAFHHRPGKCPAAAFGPLTAVHVANVWAHETQRASPIENSGRSFLDFQLDHAYLEALGLAGRLAAWRAACAGNKPTAIH